MPLGGIHRQAAFAINATRIKPIRYLKADAAEIVRTMAEERSALMRLEVLLAAGALDDLAGIVEFIAAHDRAENARGRQVYRHQYTN